MARENAVSISEKDSIIIICTIMIIIITIKLNLAPLSCGLVTYMYIVPLVRSSNHNHAFISSVRSSSGYHGLIEIRSAAAAASHFSKFFKFFRFESESESERTQHVLYF